MFRATRILRVDVAGAAKNVAQTVKSEGERNSVLQKGAKRDPELYV